MRWIWNHGQSQNPGGKGWTIYPVLISFSKQDAIADNPTQALLHGCGLCKIVHFGHKELTQSFGTSQDDSFQVSHDIVAQEALAGKDLDAFPQLCVWRLEEQRAGVAGEPMSFLASVSVCICRGDTRSTH